MDLGRDAAMITLVDRPPASATALARLRAAFEDATSEIWAVVPEYDGRHGHPFLAGREMIEVFLKAPATATARDVEHQHQQHVQYVPVDDPHVAMNVNTPEDYAALLNPQTEIIPSKHESRECEAELLVEKSPSFIQSVLQLKPRLAVFDCDGTLWSGDAGFGFFDWELNRGLVSDDVVRWAWARYADYLAGKVSEDDMCAEMVTINRGLAGIRHVARRGRVFRGKNGGRIFPRDEGPGIAAARNRLRGLGGLVHQ